MIREKTSSLSYIVNTCKPFKFYIGLHLFVILFAAIDMSLWPYLSKLLIDSVAAAGQEDTLAKTENALILLAILTALPGFVWRLCDYSWTKMIPALKAKITIEAIEAIAAHSHNFFQNNFTGAIVNRIKDLNNCTPRIIEIILYSFLKTFLCIFIAFFTVFFVHRFFAFGLLAWGILFIFIAIKTSTKTISMSSKIADQSSKITGNIADLFGNINNIKFFVNHNLEKNRTQNLCNTYTNLSEKRGFFLLKLQGVQAATFAIYFIFCIVLLVHLYSQGQVTLGDFALIFTINSWMINEMWNMSNEMRHFLEEFGTLKQALKIVDEPIEVKDVENAKTLEIGDCNEGEIIFENVEFSYKEKDPATEIKPLDWSQIGILHQPPLGANDKTAFFSNQSITIKAGQKVGLVGHSGGGKSTFINLILRAFDLTGGRILINKQDISQVTQDSLRGAIGLIPQDPSLFHRTLFENISYAKNDATKDEIIAAAKKAHAHKFIEELPQGYESLVGERGIKLSGGQRQRIAIARAFLKNAPILILDEATSQLDSITENLIQESLKDLLKNKTALIIAHRLATLQFCDRILVFDSGKIVEDGSHLDLIASNGTYKKLWNAQVGGFLAEG